MSKNPELIVSAYPIFETHCHLDYLKEDVAAIVKRSRDVGVDKLLTISVDKNNYSKSLEISRKFENVYCTQGIHPHHAIEWDQDLAQALAHNLLEKKYVRAIGEIGLDYYYKHSPVDIQQEVFEQQLQLAQNYKLPVIVHTRDAEDDTIAILKNFQFESGCLIHCYTSNLKLARYALDRNFLLGFNGIITFKNALNVREALEITPIANIVFETDAPFLAPVPFRGRENTPYYLPFIAKEIAKIKGVDELELLRTVYDSSNNFLFKE